MGIEKTRLILKTGQKINRNILCKICEQVMIDPYYCHSCLNLFCKNCLQDFHSQDKLQNCMCQNGQSKIDKAPKLITYVLSQQIFSCKNKILGCKQQINYQDVKEHELNCKFRLINCKNFECSVMIPNNQKQKHQQECFYKEVSCKFCKQYIYQGNYNEHIQNCDHRKVNCQWCNLNLKSFQYIKHLSVCSKAKFQCKSCQVFFNRKNFQSHDLIDCLRIELIKENSENDQRGINLLNKCKKLEQQIDKIFKCLINCSQCNKKCCESDLEKCEICQAVYCINCQQQKINRCSTCHYHYCIECKEQGKIVGECKNHDMVKIKKEIYTI